MNGRGEGSNCGFWAERQIVLNITHELRIVGRCSLFTFLFLKENGGTEEGHSGSQSSMAKIMMNIPDGGHYIHEHG